MKTEPEFKIWKLVVFVQLPILVAFVWAIVKLANWAIAVLRANGVKGI